MRIAKLNRKRNAMRRDMDAFETLEDELKMMASKAWKTYEDEDYEMFQRVAEEFQDTYKEAADLLSGYDDTRGELAEHIETGFGSKRSYRKVLERFDAKQTYLDELQPEKRAIVAAAQHVAVDDDHLDDSINDSWEDAYDAVRDTRRKVRETREVVETVATGDALTDAQQDGLAALVADVTKDVAAATRYDHQQLAAHITRLNSAIATDYREIHDDMVDQYQQITETTDDLLPDEEQPETVDYSTWLQNE